MLVRVDIYLLLLKELDYYSREYARNGFHSTLNWYRNHKVNFEDELKYDQPSKLSWPLLMGRSLKQSTVDIPVLFIAAARDAALPPSMSVKMEQYIPNLTRNEVDTSHWALVEAADQVNDMIKGWLKPFLDSTAKSNL